MAQDSQGRFAGHSESDLVALGVTTRGEVTRRLGVRVERIEGIQELRGVAVLLVVAVHAIFAGMAQTHRAFLPAVPNLTFFGNGGVDLFFVISGFVMAHTLARPQTARTFLIARWRRIWPLYIVGSLIFVALFPDDRTQQMATLVPTFLILPLTDTAAYHLPALKIGWTLGFETLFYLVVALAIAGRRGQVFVLAAMTFAAAASFVLTPVWAPLRMLVNPLAGEFTFGILMWLAWRWPPARAASPAVFTAAVLALLAGIAGLIPITVSTDPEEAVSGHSLARVIVWGLPWAGVTFGLACRQPRSRKDASVLSRIGDASYSIYVFHLTAIVVITRSGVVPTGSIYLYVALVAAASIAVGLAAYRWIERPLLHRLSRSRLTSRWATALSKGVA